MNRFKQEDNRMGRRAFTLVEVIIATGILATSIVAVIAFLGAIGKSTTEVMDRGVAARIADNIRAELENEDLDLLFDFADPSIESDSPNAPVLYVTKDGERVRLGGINGPVENPPDGDPPGIAERDRFFRVEIRRMENSLEFDSATFSESAMLPLSVQVVWPHQLPLGPPTSDDFTAVEKANQSRYVFNTVILRKR